MDTERKPMNEGTQNGSTSPAEPAGPGTDPRVLPGLDDTETPTLVGMARARDIPVPVDRRELISRLRAHIAPSIGKHVDGKTVCPNCGETMIVRSSGRRAGLKRYYRCPWCRTRHVLAKLTG